jgi:DNA-binding GntR family transcriptional regulator
MSGEPAERYYLEIVRQHEEMIDAIENRDVEKADALARTHTDLFRDRITLYFKAGPERSIILDSIA